MLTHTNTIAVQQLTISGDRQHGKSHLLELVAIDELIQERRLLWLSASLNESREMFRRTERAIRRRGVLDPRQASRLTFRRAAGAQEIALSKTFGAPAWIMYGSTRQCPLRGATFDTLLVDAPDADLTDILEQLAPCMSAQPRVISTVTTGDR